MLRIEIVTTRPHIREIVIAKNGVNAHDLVRNVMEKINYRNFDNITFSIHKILDIEETDKKLVSSILSKYCNEVKYEYEVEDRI